MAGTQPTADPKPLDWKDISALKQQQRDSLLKWKLDPKLLDDKILDVTHIPAESGILDQLELEITDSNAETILKKLAEGVWTSEDVTVAFCKRASIAQQLTNCLTEICFDDAIARAKELDAMFKDTGKLAGPLHGLPVSIKDNFKIKGLDSTLGFICWANKPLDEDSVLITILREAGAVLYCKTNVPTAMMIAETYNNVWGRTTNPYNRSLSCGGSSGGEAALLALKGSPLGVGTDIGGSIRIPGTFCGLYSLRPSFGRFPTYGARSGLAGQEAVNSVNGPLSRSLEALSIFASAVVDGGKPWLHDPKAVPIPWRAVNLPKKLSIGVMKHDGVVRPHPPVERALDLALGALKKAGHEVIEFTSFDSAKGLFYLANCFTADGGISIKKLIAESGEDWPLGLLAYKETSHHPSTYELWQLQAGRTEYQKNSLDHWMKTKELTSTGREIDFILCPTTPYAACPHDTFEYVGYTGIYNVIDWAAATIPVLRASPEIDVRTPEYDAYKPVSAIDERIWKTYEPEKYAGGPVSVQLVGRRLEEEKVLAGCKVLEEALKSAGVRVAPLEAILSALDALLLPYHSEGSILFITKLGPINYD
ncbi:amidase [Clavulina sp. PMI_390]|nr:amidase [Clavulina sp. PMI_390]